MTCAFFKVFTRFGFLKGLFAAAISLAPLLLFYFLPKLDAHEMGLSDPAELQRAIDEEFDQVLEKTSNPPRRRP